MVGNKEAKNIVKLLLENKADVNATNGDGQTSLHRAAATNQKEAAEVLLMYHSQIDAKDKAGKTP